MVKNKNLKFIYNVVGFAVIVFLAIREICGAVLARLPFEADSAVMLIIGIAVFLAACLVPTITIENTLGLHPKLFRKTNATDTLAAAAGRNFHPRIYAERFQMFWHHLCGDCIFPCVWSAALIAGKYDYVCWLRCYSCPAVSCF